MAKWGESVRSCEIGSGLCDGDRETRLIAPGKSGHAWSVPCIKQTGTSIFFKSLVESVSEDGLDAFVIYVRSAHHALAPPVVDETL